MFTNVYTAAEINKEPWLLPLSTRLAFLQEDSKSKRVIWLYRQADTSTFRYRVFNPVSCLRDDNNHEWAASWFYESELLDLYRYLHLIDRVIICRMHYSLNLANFIHAAKENGISVGFDCDDLVFDTRYVPTLLDTLDQDMRSKHVLDYWYADIARLEATLRLCDFGIATNSFLAEKMKTAMGGLETHILPNFLERHQQNISARFFENKVRGGFSRTETLTIGYFSGSPSHNKDFLVAAGAIRNVMRRHRDVLFRVVGFLDTVTFLDEFADRVEIVPLQDYCNLQRLISEVEINISPLQNNEFTNCKSELKYFEAAVVGTFTVATPIHSFKKSMADERFGILTEGHAWEDSLESAIKLAKNADAYSELALKSHNSVIENYGWNKFTEAILSCIE